MRYDDQDLFLGLFYCFWSRVIFIYSTKIRILKPMKTLLDFLLESRGADIDKRTADRFFGDKYDRDRELKTTISKSIQALKTLKEKFTDKEYEMLTKLADNKMTQYDDRSNVTISNHTFKDNSSYIGFSFALSMFNFPKAILNKLSAELIQKKCGDIRHLSCNCHGFGAIYTTYININGYDKDPDSVKDKERAIKATKYVLETIEPIFDDIITYKDNSKDEDAVSRRQWQKEQAKKAKEELRNIDK